MNKIPSRTLRILHVIDSGGLYGAEKVLLNLGTECRKLGHEVLVGTIVAPQEVGDALGDAAKAADLGHVQFSMRDGPNILGVRQVLKFARDRRVDVIHSHGYKANILLALTPPRLRPCPMICTLHGWTAGGRKSRLALYEWLERRLVGTFDRIVVVSRTIQEGLPGRQAGVELVPNGVAPQDRHMANRVVTRQTGADGATRIMAAGRLSYEKGFDVLIDAIGVLRARGMKVGLTIAGEGPLRGQLESQVARASLAEEVRLPGHVPILDALYDAADLFVLSSRTEGLPLVLLEAMSRGVPVIATAVGQVPEVLGHGEYGHLVDSTDPNSLAEAIQAHAREPQRRIDETVQRAAQRVHKAYSAAGMAAAYCRIYRECAHGR